MSTKDHPKETTQSEQTRVTEIQAGVPTPEIGLPGTVLNGRYLIEKRLGQGGIGVVYLARDKQLLSRPVVIKVLLDEMEGSANRVWFKKKFRQEIEALARIDHPGVVGVLDTGEMPDGKAFLVMQYVEGVNLRSVMTSEGVAFDRVATIIRQVGQALTAAHDREVFHRDVKPENIMLHALGDGEEQARLIDFGIATVRHSQVSPDQTKTLTAGTLPYMAPEQLRGKPEAASDTFSLAIVAYEMLTGRLPFVTDSPYEMLEQHQAGVKVKPTELQPRLPEAAQAELLRALSYDPNQRHQRTRDFGDTLARALTEPAAQKKTPVVSLPPPVANVPPVQPSEKVIASQETVLATTVGPARNNGPLIIAVAMLSLLLAALGFGYWKLTGDKAAVIPPVTPAPALPERTLGYGISLSRNRNGREQQIPRINGKTIVFEQNDRIRFTVTSPQSGWLYLINENPKGSRYHLLFPLPVFQQGAAKLDAGREWELPAFRFDSDQGAETVWLIWAEQPVPSLDALIRWVNDKDMSEIKDTGEREKLREFLKTNSATQPSVVNDDARKLTLVKGRAPIIVTPIRFEHF
jgi:serine/threonine-protein kinase